MVNTLPFSICNHCDEYCAVDSSTHLLARSPHRGLHILWRKSLGEKCNMVDFDDMIFTCNLIVLKMQIISWMGYMSRVNDIY